MTDSPHLVDVVFANLVASHYCSYRTVDLHDYVDFWNTLPRNYLRGVSLRFSGCNHRRLSAGTSLKARSKRFSAKSHVICTTGIAPHCPRRADSAQSQTSWPEQPDYPGERVYRTSGSSA